MVEIPESLECLFSAPVEVRDDTILVEVPRAEVEAGDIELGEIYRVALLRQSGTESEDQSVSQPPESPTHNRRDGPPVEEGEIRPVTIETTGDQGDGLAKVDRGYVVIVPDATPGQEPIVEIEHARENVAFARIVENG